MESFNQNITTFSRSGGMYLPFPDNRHHRVLLSDFVREDVRVLFQTI